MKQYSREFLLSFAEKENCRRLPDDLDPALWRNSPSPDIVDGGVGGSAKFTGRRDREYHHELPEWRSRASANGGLLSQQGPLRKKNYDEEVYPSRGPSSWEGNHVRNHDRAGLQGPGQAKWDHRSSIDRERERGGRGHNWDGAEDSVSRPRYGWNASEHDGLLGSGGGLRGAYPGGPDRYNGGGRGNRNHNHSESRSSKLMGSRNDSDSLDGETFGEKNSTEDRAEEERRRRESFESMRKEQQRLKEQKKQQEKDQRGGYAVEEHFDTQVSSSAAPTVPSTPRPLVPPGFSQSSLQKHAIKKENKEQETREEQVKPDNHNSSSVQTSHQPKDNKVDPIVIACSMSEAEDVFALTEKPMSLIEKLLDKASSGTVPLSSPFSTQVETSNTVEQPKTSRFAHLFSVEDENATMGFLSLLNSSTPTSKLSGGGSPRSPVSTIVETSDITGQLGSRLPMPAGPSLEDIEKSLESSVELASDANSSFPFSPRPEKPPQTFFTCEDLEQSLLAEASDTEWTQNDKRSWKEGDDADTDASRHLLSLLQKASVRSEDEPKVEEKVFEERRIDKEGTEGGVATLEALFGMSFMMELRSTDTPLSAKAVTETSSSSIIQPAKSAVVNELTNVIDGKYPAPSKQSWDLWVSKAGKTGGNAGAERSQHLPFDDTRNALEVDKNPTSDISKFNVYEDYKMKQDNKLGLENGDFGSRSMEQVEIGRELNGSRNHSNDELDSGVLNDFLKFKKAIQHRNKVNDSFLGLVEGSTDNTSSMLKEQPERASVEVTSGTPASVAVPGTLYRSHSPPQINQKSNTLQLQQLQQALTSHGSKALKQQQQQQFMLGNGDLGVGDSRYGRTGHPRPGFSRQQQQPAMYPGAHEQQQLHHHPPHFVPPGQTFPSHSSSSFVGPHDVMYNAKQQQQQQRPQAPGYFPPNGSNQPLNNLHLAHAGHHHVPPMNYAAPPPFGPGFVGYPPPNEGFIGGEHAGERWIGREPHLGAIPGLFQQHQRIYGMNKLGFP